MTELKQNELIAEFMGHKLGLDGDGMGEPQCRIFEKGLGTKRIEDTYSNSWDWLMPVIEEIDHLNHEPIDTIEKALSTRSVKDTHKAVVEFIVQLNKNKHKEDCLKYLKDKGYAVDCLWHIDDVQQMIECDDETAIKILNESLESDNVCEVVYEMLDYIALNEYKVKLKE